MISVCMATFNGELFIKEQLSSILSQIGPLDELIVSDDHSTDRTIEIIEKFGDNRIKIFFNENVKGFTKNFENAIKHAIGDVIFLSDQDDVWIDGKVSKVMDKLLHCDIVVTDAEIVDSNLNTISPSHFKLNHVRKGFWINLSRTRYIGACMAFKRKVLMKALPFPKKTKYCAHDYWLTLIGEAFYKLELIDEPLLKYRRHSNNASTGGAVSSNSLVHKLAVRGYCLLNLISRIGK